MEFWQQFSSNEFLPHGYCIAWQPGLLWLHVLSDGFTALAYYSIPMALAYFVGARKDLAYRWIFWLFTAFIFFCGTTHLFAVITLWEPLYWVDGTIKAMTASVSILTAILLWPLIPKALALPSPTDLATTNQKLQQQIVERMQVEQEIRKLNDVLKNRAHELESAVKELEEISYSISHDLRSPLRAVAGFSRLLDEEFATQLPATAQRYLSVIHNNAVQMGQLIDDLLTYARVGRHEVTREPVLPADLAHKAFDLLQAERVERQIELTVDDLPACEADPNLLKQVWINLFSNAIKYTSSRNVAIIKVGVEVKNGRPIFFVRDNGIGFNMQYAQKIFGMFQRLHHAEEYEGTGVGLAIVRRAVRLHGGEVWAESEVNTGTTFYFTLEGDSHDK